jgi:hypothetical protein
MTDNVENLILEHIKALRYEMRDFRQENWEEFSALIRSMHPLLMLRQRPLDARIRHQPYHCDQHIQRP